MEKLKLQQVEPHPDLPGYDAWYSFSVRRDGHELSADEFTLRTDLACRIQGNEVTVPLAVKEQNAGVRMGKAVRYLFPVSEENGK